MLSPNEKSQNADSTTMAQQQQNIAPLHETTTPPAGLDFDQDAGSWRSKLLAALLVVGIIGWMGSGAIFPAPEEEKVDTAPVAGAVAVATRMSTAQSITQVFVAEGQAQPDRESVIRAEISGEIAEVFVKKGDLLEKNQVVARFDGEKASAELERAKEDMRVAQREFDNAEALRERGAATADRVSAARAALVRAQTGLSDAQKDLDDTIFKAPFAGRLDVLDIDEGEFVAAGTDVGRIIDTAPLTIVVQVPQRTLGLIKTGQKAQVAFITGQEVIGEVVYIGGSADAETRTFRAEIEVPNENNEIASGLSAQVRIPTGEATAHFVSPAILSLDTDGTLGVKTVEEGNKVKFNKVNIVRAQTDGVWVEGLPLEAQIITIGQGYVSDGEDVVTTSEPVTNGSAS